MPHALHDSSLPRQGSSLYYAAQSAPARTRAALLAWIEWWHEVSAIPLTVSDPNVANTKLAWWQQEVLRGFDGSAQHPLMRALMAPDLLRAPSRLPPPALWLEQLEGLQDLLQQTRWLDQTTQRRNALHTTGAACEGAAWILGAASDEAAAVARELGWGLRQAHQLARLGQDARLGWLHVPVSVLQQHDVKAHEVLRPDPTHTPAGWPALLTYLAAQASSSLVTSLSAIAALPSPQRRALTPLSVLARLQQAQVEAIAHSGAAVLQQRIILTPVRKWWLATQVRWESRR